MNLTKLQESYLQGLRQMTAGSSPKKVTVAPTQRAGLGSRGKQQTGKEYSHFSRRDQLMTAFDVSNKALLASLFFWILLMYGMYTVFGYGLMAVRVMYDEGDLKEECQAQFSQDAQENLQIVSNYPKGDTAPYIARFASDRGAFQDYPADAKKLPPLVTAIGSSQFFLLQGFIQHINQDLKAEHKDLKLIVYDIGLYKREKEILKQYGGCEVRTVEYELFPDHVADTTNFAWRPIVIQTLLEEFGAVVYVDVTTRFKTSNSLNAVRSRGLNDFLLWDVPAFTSTTAYTNKLMFQHLNETRCLFTGSGLVDSQLMVFYKTNKTWNVVMKPWLKCALTQECIAPSWSRGDRCLHYRRPKTTGCHRFDMSALSIVLNRGVQMTTAGHANHYTPPRFIYVSEEESAVFEQQPWTNVQLMILLFMPCLFLMLIFRRQMQRFFAATILKEN